MSVVPRLVTRNWRLKLAATGLAVFLWAVVRSAPESTSAMVRAQVEVDMSGSPQWTTARLPEPSAVDVQVRGSLDDIEQLRRTGVAVRIPVGAVTGADTTVTLRRDWAVVEGAVSVERIEPAQVHLVFEESTAAAKPITIRPVGDLPDRWALARPLQLSPVVMSLRGPASMVEAVDSIPTLGPDLSQIRESGLYEVPLDTAAFPGLTFAASAVSVTVRLEEAAERELGAVPVVFGEAPEAQVPSSELSPDPPLVRVRLRGGATRVAQVLGPEVRAEVDAAFIQTLAPGEVRLVPLRVTGVPDLVEATPRPDSVRVRRSGEDGGASPEAGRRP